MTEEMKMKMEEMAEKYGPNEGVCHTHRDKPAWHYSVIDYKSGFTAAHDLMQAEVEEACSARDHWRKIDLENKALIKDLAEWKAQAEKLAGAIAVDWKPAKDRLKHIENLGKALKAYEDFKAKGDE